MKPHLYTKI